MKLKTVKKRFINSKKFYSNCPKEAEEIGLKFWKESIKTIKKMFWHAGEFNRTPAFMIEFCDATNGIDGVER
tara:strand:- start:1781 stop:1996 length:216 start_codon:yes stop_codon:yes gene_type:complete